MNHWSQRTWAAIVAAACLLAAVVTTWPLALHLPDALPLGTESAATVPLFDVWTLWWNSNRLPHGYAGLWDAPIFHPTSGAFALSEPLLLPGALAAPLFWLGAPPALAHNLVLLLLLTGNGVLGCRVMRALEVPRPAALMIGVVVVTLPVLGKLQGELPLLPLGGVLLTLDGLVRFGQTGATRAAIWAGAGVIGQALLGQQLALMAAPFLLAAAGVALANVSFARGAGARLAAAILIAGGVAYLLAARTPLAVLAAQNLDRPDDVVRGLSAHLSDFLTRPGTALVPLPAREAPETFTGGLFPGLLLLGLGAVGATAPVGDARLRRWRWGLLATAAGAGLLTLGLNLSVGGWGPFAALRALPGFRHLRSVFRFAVLAQLSLALLAGLGLADLLRRWPPSRRRWLIALGLCAAVENLCLPAPLVPVPRSPRAAWTRSLGALPAGTVVAHVPFPASGDVAALEPEAWRLFAQMDHRQPLLNGYASHFPALHREFMFAMGNAFPQHDLTCALRRVFSVDRLVVDRAWLAAHQAGMNALQTILQPAYFDTDVAIYRLAPTEAECPPMRIDLGPPTTR